jgi:transposase
LLVVSIPGAPVFARERLSFCPAPNVAYTKWLVKYVLALRREMSITAVAKFTGLHWESVKEIEKRYLTKKYAKVRLVDRKFNWLIGNSIG